MAAELPFRLSAQVISTVTDNSRIDTTPSQAACAVITATKGPINTLQLVQTQNALFSVFGQPTPDHIGLVGAAKIIANGNAMYLVRVAGDDVAPAVATIKGIRSEEIKVGPVSGTDNIQVFNLSGTAASSLGAYSVECGYIDGALGWVAQFTPNGGSQEDLELTVDTERQMITLGDTGLVVHYDNLVPGQWSFETIRSVAVGTVSAEPQESPALVLTGDVSSEPGIFMLTCTDGAWTGTFAPASTGVAASIVLTVDTVARTIVIGSSGLTATYSVLLPGEGSVEYRFEVTASPVVSSVNLLLTFKDLGTYGNQFSVSVQNKSGGKQGEYTIGLFNGSLRIKSYDFTLDESGESALPFVLDLLADEFTVSLENELVIPQSLVLTSENIPFVDGNDGLDQLTANDYIGEADMSSGTYTGSKLFLQPSVVANIFCSLGYTDKAYLASMKIIGQQKKMTCIYDTPAGLPMSQAINWLENSGPYNGDSTVLEGYQCEVYWPWMDDNYNGTPLVMPPSTYITLNSLASFALVGTHMPVAGQPRGIISGVSPVTQIPDVADRDTLITHRINPIYDTGINGTQIFGNETLNNDYTDLRSAHIGRTLVDINRKIDAFTSTLFFNLNDPILWQTWMDGASAILNPIRDRRGLNWFGVRMGLDTTSRSEIAQRQIRGIIGLQFVQDAEVFWLNYVVYPSSAEEIDF